MAFFVRGAEIVPCPCCGRELRVIGSRLRKSIKPSGDIIVLNIRRLRCTHCSKIHHELPDFIVPYKRYDADSIETVVSNDSVQAIAADDCTLYRWRNWFQVMANYLLGCLISLSIRNFQVPVDILSVAPQSALQRIGHFVGDAPGWLGRIVRPITNLNLWLHTRSAFLSGNA
ncbi:hypothetical protein SAMN02745133_01613 [Desulforamulus putei DSM 12395]|uniref:DUF6431 domain-containing protein n=1 Tax=Desulforamulus putei DSM 12395 TaxID=1121429 RepID=A0A1M4Y2G1_9FIRM|nr:DUF6431 domain-containing protein [Desulforamulus putei]SHE99756.1 hypothetical protein SAMN02745133_01613 [Desulforamulus putei DSM 12395]